MVFERLGLSLYDLIKKRDYKGLPIAMVKSISRQLLSALKFLKPLEIIHTDLKCENILFAESQLSTGEDGLPLPASTKIKLIDFGGATYDDDESKTTIINTRQYRAPEVTLECGWSYPSDIWGAGCIIAELCTGELLFATHDNLEHLGLMEAILKSTFSSWMIRDATRSLRGHFTFDGHVIQSDLPRDSVEWVREAKTIEELFAPFETSGVIGLLKALLTIDPKIRPTAAHALYTYTFVSGADDEV